MEGYFEKKENEKEKARKCCLINKEKLKKRLRKHHRNLSYEDKIKKEIMLTLEIKIYQTQIEKKKEYMKS